MAYRFSWPVLILFLKHVGPLFRLGGWTVVALLAGYVIAGDGETALRYAGAFLQLAGLATVVLGLMELGKLFKRRGARAWLREAGRLLKLVVVVPDPIVMKAGGAGVVVATGTATLRVTLAKGAPLHKRITQLETDLASLREQVKTTTETLKRSLSDLRDQQAQTIQTVRKELKATTENLENVAVGGLEREAVGVVWLFLGMILSSFAPEISKTIGLLLF